MSPIIILPTSFGNFSVIVSDDENSSTSKWVVIFKRPWGDLPFLRIHSSCLFSESFASTDCDCASQLQHSLGFLSKCGGAIVYLYQEGRGMGLLAKVNAMFLQQKNDLETADAYSRLGYDLDPRDYSNVSDALSAITFPRRIRLATNNPRKVRAMTDMGYEVVERYQIPRPSSERIRKYLSSKEKGLGHYEQD